MKANAKELFEVVRAVVREEVQKVLPQMVREHLTETYIRKMVLEAAVKNPAAKKASLAELLAPTSVVDEDEIPHPQQNSDLGIYNPANLTNPETNRKKNESRAVPPGVAKLAKDLGPMAWVLEGVKVPGEEGATPDVPVEKINPDFERMARLVEATDKASSSRKIMDVSPESKMRELEMRRKALDVPARK